MHRVARVAVSAVAAAWLLVACSGDGQSRTPRAAPSTTPSRTPSTSAVSDHLLPNLRSIAASDISIQQVGQDRRLRFAAALANLGPGPLLLEPRARGGCPPGQHQADQLVHRDADADGVFRRRLDVQTVERRAGCMLRHPTHDHWHFDAMAAYSLRRPGQAAHLAARDKVSFCLRDNTRVQGQPTRVRREYFGDCTRNGPQGISPGWVDVYRADLDGQWLLLPPGVNGLLCLDLEADPLGRLAETDEADNGTSIALRVAGVSVRRAQSGRC